MLYEEWAPGPHLCKAPQAVRVGEENPEPFNSRDREREKQRLWPGQGEGTLNQALELQGIQRGHTEGSCHPTGGKRGERQ